MNALAVATFVLALLALAESSRGRGRSVQYQHFDDFLLSALTTQNSDFNQVLKAPEQRQQQQVSSTQAPTPQPARTVDQGDILGYFRDVPREHWSCCMLGKLAGDKGFHCHAGFYAERMQTRNQNRAQNQRTPMHGRTRIPRWGRDIMSTFQRCVSRHSSEFHKCCYAATVEQRERHRWRRYRVVRERPVNPPSDDQQ